MIFPDTHVDHEDPAALACALRVASIWRPDELVVLGDMIDGASVSSHPRRSFEERSGGFLESEIAPVNAILDKLQGRNHRPLVYCEGNHEQRVERFALGLGKFGEDLYRLASPQRLLRYRVDAQGRPRSERQRFTWVPYIKKSLHSHYLITRELKHSSALVAIHGWSTAKNAAAAHLALARNFSVVHGHTHRAQSATVRNAITDMRYKAWSPGCLCDLRPVYTATSPNDWTHGFSLVYVGEDSWTDYTIPIHSDGSCILPSGRRVVG